ncbi:uncharacterized protein LOC128811854 [Vidua macroura]|uniref:uncharacterized protein LOC128811854 n=1 Tax=Vidua macroura TaxID=187451 RepID=UPI0023A86F94|nr:uncharacterized protein LOC128811854 [Vidua macroura]
MRPRPRAAAAAPQAGSAYLRRRRLRGGFRRFSSGSPPVLLRFSSRSPHAPALSAPWPRRWRRSGGRASPALRSERGRPRGERRRLGSPRLLACLPFAPRSSPSLPFPLLPFAFPSFAFPPLPFPRLPRLLLSALLPPSPSLSARLRSPLPVPSVPPRSVRPSPAAAPAPGPPRPGLGRGELRERLCSKSSQIPAWMGLAAAGARAEQERGSSWWWLENSPWGMLPGAEDTPHPGEAAAICDCSL